MAPRSLVAELRQRERRARFRRSVVNGSPSWLLAACVDQIKGDPAAAYRRLLPSPRRRIPRRLAPPAAAGDVLGMTPAVMAGRPIALPEVAKAEGMTPFDLAEVIRALASMNSQAAGVGPFEVRHLAWLKPLAPSDLCVLDPSTNGLEQAKEQLRRALVRGGRPLQPGRGVRATHRPVVAAHLLLRLFNGILADTPAGEAPCLPEPLRQARLVALRKFPSGWRPITISHPLHQLFDALVAHRIEE